MTSNFEGAGRSTKMIFLDGRGWGLVLFWTSIVYFQDINMDTDVELLSLFTGILQVEVISRGGRYRKNWTFKEAGL